MLKKKALNRIFFSTVIFFLVFTLSTFKVFNNYSETKELDNNTEKETLYTLNDDGYISKTVVYVGKIFTLEDKIREKLEIMTKENNKNSLLPSYFKPILPANTKVLDVKVADSLVKVYFSKELKNITEEQSEKMIEAITYTIIDENILGIEIYVENDMLRYIPHTKKELPTVLTKDFGINKTYSISRYSDVTKVVMNYYTAKGNDFFVVPVTKYVNDDREVLEIIFEEFNSLNPDVKLISLLDDFGVNRYEIKDRIIIVDVSRELTEEESNVLSVSIFNNYDIDKIAYLVNGQKKCEKTLKDIEK